jgi:hypothetical protein
VEHHEAVAGEAAELAGGVALAVGAALPAAGLLGGPEPQPPPDQRGHRQPRESGPRQAGLGGEDLAGEAGGGDQRRPPGQAAGPAGQLLGAAPAVGAQGGAAGAAVAAGDRLSRHRWQRRGRWGPGTPEGVRWWVQRGPAAAQQPGGLVVVGVQEALELLGGQGPHRQAAALVDRRAQLLQVLLVAVVVAVEVLVLVVEVIGLLVLAHVGLPSAS